MNIHQQHSYAFSKIEVLIGTVHCVSCEASERRRRSIRYEEIMQLGRKLVRKSALIYHRNIMVRAFPTSVYCQQASYVKGSILEVDIATVCTGRITAGPGETEIRGNRRVCPRSDSQKCILKQGSFHFHTSGHLQP
jgi:hypothetical protein